MPTLYSHRNGETEPPAKTGVYWFLGRHNGRLWHYAFIYLDTSPHTVTKIDEEWEIPFADLDGKWWGPVSTPWGQDAAQRSG